MFLPRFEFGLPSLGRGLVVLGLFAASGGALLYSARAGVGDDELAPGLTVDGVAPEGDLPAFVAERARILRSRKVQLVSAEVGKERVVLETTLGELGVAVDEGRVADMARSVGKSGSFMVRRQMLTKVRRGEVDVPLVPAVDARAALGKLDAVKEVEDSMPISARLDIDHGTVVPERPGRYIDADAVMAEVVAMARTKGEEPLRVKLPIIAFAPRITSAFVKSIDVGAVLADYETGFSRRGDQDRRGKNIDVAASKVDGLVLSPGELVSFNEVVGERSEENGFQKSWEIFKGEMKEGVGGGTCQVASTVHAAAFFSGIDIVERLPHSRPSAYIPMGLDATVVYPVVDMKLRNPFSFPIVVHAVVDGNRLHVEMRGARRLAHVSFQRELVKTIPYTRKVEEKPHLAGHKVIIKQHGIRGYRIERERTLTYLRNGKKRVEKNKDFYPPTTEIYEVPPGFDVSLLPPLPVMDDDEGEGSDTSAQAAATAQAAAANVLAQVVAPGMPVSALAPASCSGEGCPPPAASASANPSVRMEDAPGAHAPTTAQSKPPKKMTIRR